MAKITMTSTLTGITRCLTIPSLSQDEFDRRYAAYRRGECSVIEAFQTNEGDSMLTDAQIEFIKSGITSEEWKKYIEEKLCGSYTSYT